MASARIVTRRSLIGVPEVVAGLEGVLGGDLAQAGVLVGRDGVGQVSDLMVAAEGEVPLLHAYPYRYLFRAALACAAQGSVKPPCRRQPSTASWWWSRAGSGAGRDSMSGGRPRKSEQDLENGDTTPANGCLSVLLDWQ
jgi:hypothetical protein